MTAPDTTSTRVQYDFDQEFDRRASDSAKWAFFDADILPLWVADTDFPVAESIQAALRARAEHPIFGYPMDGTPRLRTAIVNWMQTRHQWTIKPTDLYFVPNLVSALYATSRLFGDPGDNTLLHTPIYQPFLWAVRDSERNLNRLELIPFVDDHILTYGIDFDAVEAAINPRTKLWMICNPHNPAGYVYSRTDLEKVAEIALKHDLYVVSDEIHSDLILDKSQGRPHIPLASISPEIAARTITLAAPSKSFNIAGLGFGMVVITDPALAERFTKATFGIMAHSNIFGFAAAEAAYTDDSGWLEQNVEYMRENRDYAVAYVRENMPDVNVTNPVGTYLLWLDFRAYNLTPTAGEYFKQNAKVGLIPGEIFGSGYEGFVRLNVGCTKRTLKQGLDAMKDAVDAMKAALPSS